LGSYRKVSEEEADVAACRWWKNGRGVWESLFLSNGLFKYDSLAIRGDKDQLSTRVLSMSIADASMIMMVEDLKKFTFIFAINSIEVDK